MALPLDTTADAQDVQRRIYQRLGGEERASISFRLTALVCEATLAGIRRRHPEYSERQVQAALARMRLGDELMKKAFPDSELIDP